MYLIISFILAQWLIRFTRFISAPIHPAPQTISSGRWRREGAISWIRPSKFSFMSRTSTFYPISQRSPLFGATAGLTLRKPLTIGKNSLFQPHLLQLKLSRRLLPTRHSRSQKLIRYVADLIG